MSTNIRLQRLWNLHTLAVKMHDCFLWSVRFPQARVMSVPVQMTSFSYNGGSTKAPGGLCKSLLKMACRMLAHCLSAELSEPGAKLWSLGPMSEYQSEPETTAGGRKDLGINCFLKCALSQSCFSSHLHFLCFCFEVTECKLGCFSAFLQFGLSIQLSWGMLSCVHSTRCF